MFPPIRLIGAAQMLKAARNASILKVLPSGAALSLQQTTPQVVARHTHQKATTFSRSCHHQVVDATRATKVTTITAVSCDDQDPDLLVISCSDGRVLRYPVVWLRAHCQCSDCYDVASTARSLLMDDFQLYETITACATTSSGGVSLQWSSSHRSEFTASWLLERAFEEQARQKRRETFALPKKLWTVDHQVSRYTYHSLMSDDSVLLRWLQELETTGAALVTEVPPEMTAGNELANKIGFPKRTAFGIYSNIRLTENANNLAYTNAALNLHNDLPYYDEMPGIVLLHIMEQHKGQGGDTIVSDGFHSAEHMRQNYPDQFRILSSTNMYYYDQGIDNNNEAGKRMDYYRLNRTQIFSLDNDGQLKMVRFSNQLLDSYSDMPLECVKPYYSALKLYYTLIKENSICFKLKDGEILVLDNFRCQHGRKLIVGHGGDRHLVNSFISWDEAKCKRRRMAEQSGL